MKAKQPTEHAPTPKPVDLSEYTEEKIPFDTVIRRIAKAKPMHRVAPKKIEKKPAK